MRTSLYFDTMLCVEMVKGKLCHLNRTKKQMRMLFDHSHFANIADLRLTKA